MNSFQERWYSSVANLTYFHQILIALFKEYFDLQELNLLRWRRRDEFFPGGRVVRDGYDGSRCIARGRRGMFDGGVLENEIVIQFNDRVLDAPRNFRGVVGPGKSHVFRVIEIDIPGVWRVNLIVEKMSQHIKKQNRWSYCSKNLNIYFFDLPILLSRLGRDLLFAGQFFLLLLPQKIWTFPRHILVQIRSVRTTVCHFLWKKWNVEHFEKIAPLNFH